MPGRFDELSRAIGDVEAEVRGLKERASEDRLIARDRHAENQASIGSLKVMVGDLTETIATYGPQIRSLQASRSKLVFYASVGITALAAGGFLLESAIMAAVTWLLAKFGGG